MINFSITLESWDYLKSQDSYLDLSDRLESVRDADVYDQMTSEKSQHIMGLCFLRNLGKIVRNMKLNTENPAKSRVASPIFTSPVKRIQMIDLTRKLSQIDIDTDNSSPEHVIYKSANVGSKSKKVLKQRPIKMRKKRSKSNLLSGI